MISSFIKWYTDVNIGCFDVADISAILTNFVSIISSVPEYGIHNVKHDWFSDSAVPHNTRRFLAVYACQVPLPASSQDSLLSGWVNLG